MGRKQSGFLEADERSITARRVRTQEIKQGHFYTVDESIQFIGFHDFLLERFLPEEQRAAWQEKPCPEETLATLRKSAYQNCYQRIRKNCPVARATLRSWFHVGKSARPSRSQLFAFAFALSLSVVQMQEYLVQGLQEPGIQVNDYQEIINCYGLERGLSYEECQDMMAVFEREVNKDTVFAQNTHTDELWNLYEEKKYLPKADFLLWMCENAFYFKGYSKVALNAFVNLKHEILEYIRGEAKDQLYDALQETGFFVWASANQVQEASYREAIPRYVHNVMRRKDNHVMDEYAKEEIARLRWIVYASKEKNSDLLAELYASALTYGKEGAIFKKKKMASRKQFDLPESVYFMTDKYVSQLIGVAQQKEKEIRLSMARGTLLAQEKEAVCPKQVRQCMEAYGLWRDTATSGETLEVLEHALRHQKQRCQLVKRSDLLPLIHYVAQKRYEQQREEEYVREDAIQIFASLANTIFQECQMMELNEKYQLDYWFLSTYGESDMYSMSDLIEAAMR